MDCHEDLDARLRQHALGAEHVARPTDAHREDGSARGEREDEATLLERQELAGGATRSLGRDPDRDPGGELLLRIVETRDRALGRNANSARKCTFATINASSTQRRLATTSKDAKIRRESRANSRVSNAHDVDASARGNAVLADEHVVALVTRHHLLLLCRRKPRDRKSDTFLVRNSKNERITRTQTTTRHSRDVSYRERVDREESVGSCRFSLGQLARVQAEHIMRWQQLQTESDAEKMSE